MQGTVELLPQQPSLALELQWKDLRWPLAGEPVIESPTGRGRIDGTMPLRYDLTAETRGPDVPAASWQARGSIDTTTLVVDSVDGSVLKGRVKASGRISWKDAAPWAITIDGNALDLAELRPDWPGRIDMKGSIEGRGLSAGAPWSARIANLSGTLRGRRLTGRGEVAHRGGVYELRQVRISNVDSRVDINGRVGKDMDLRWDAQLASLSLVDPALRGQLVTSGRVSGTMRKPRVTGTASVRDLSTGTVHFRLVSADMDLDVADHSESHVDIDATEGGIDTL